MIVNKLSITSFFAWLALAALVALASASASAETYGFSVTPWGSDKEMKSMYRPLLDYLEENTGAKFEVVISPGYNELIEDLANGYIDFAVLNAVGFLKLRRMSPDVRLLAVSMRDFGDFERDYYLGYFITRKESEINSFDDLEGTVFGFVTRGSGSGYKMPLAVMGLKGLSPDTYFKKYFFMGNHDELIKAVKNKCVAAGATWEASYETNKKKYGDIFKIIFTTPPIPNDAWLTTTSMPEELSDQIKGLLLGINKRTRTSNGVLVLDPKTGVKDTGYVERNADFFEKSANMLLYEEQTNKQ